MELGRTVTELENTLSVSEFKEWIEFYQLEPFGAWRDNWNTATIAHILANVNRGKNRPAIPLKEFMWTDSRTRSKEKTDSFKAFLDTNTKE